MRGFPSIRSGDDEIEADSGAPIDLAALLQGLASRMDPAQRHAFIDKMAEMDRRRLAFDGDVRFVSVGAFRN